jgi:hypothetical protein
MVSNPNLWLRLNSFFYYILDVRLAIPRRTGLPLISASTPKRCKHFPDDRDRGSVEATAKVAQTLFHLGTVEKNVACVIAWMKACAGWRKTVRQKNTGADSKPMASVVTYCWAGPAAASGGFATIYAATLRPARLEAGERPFLHRARGHGRATICQGGQGSIEVLFSVT